MGVGCGMYKVYDHLGMGLGLNLAAQFQDFQFARCQRRCIGQVVLHACEHLGKVREISNLAANGIFVVNGDRGEILIPAISQVIVSVDVEKKKIVIRKIEGLY